MTENLPEDQLQQLDFNRITASNSSSHTDVNQTTNQSSQLLANEKISFAKFSEKEMQRFESFFNTYVHKDTSTSHLDVDENLDLLPKEDIDLSKVMLSQDASQISISQLEKDLIEQFSLEDPPVDFDGNEDDLIDLETLLLTSYPDEHDSLHDLFAEITDNEKKPISNYESAIFNANVQSIFEEDENEDIILDDSVFEEILVVIDDDFEFPDLPPTPHTFSDDPPLFGFELPPVPTEPIILVEEVANDDDSLGFDLPPIPESLMLVEDSVSKEILDFEDFELPPTPEVTTFANESQRVNVPVLSPADIANTFFDSGEKIDTENHQTAMPQTKKKKKLTFQIFDTILILVIIVILILLAVNLSDSLPFNLPFL